MPEDSTLGGDGRFPTTRWSAVLGTRSEDEEERRRSWHAIVGAYWRAVYKHVRLRWRKSRDDAADLTQAFFSRALEREFFQDYDPVRARFRTFVRVCLDRFVSNEEKARRRQKRGSGRELLSLDFDGAEAELQLADPAADPEGRFDQEWRRSLFSLAVGDLRQQCEAKGKQTVFAAFERYDLCDGPERPTYDVLACELGIPTTTVTNQLAFARREIRRLVLERLAELTASDQEYEGEARDLVGGAR